MIKFAYRVEPTAGPQGLGAAPPRTLRAGEFLFRQGEPKTEVYRVDSGAICVNAMSGGGGEPFIEFVYRGDWLGFGYLDKHTSQARAIVPTRVTCLPQSSVDALIACDPHARARLADANEREYALIRHTLSSRQQTPIERVAALLLSLASINAQEGREMSIVVDTVPSGFIAETLKMSVEMLANALLELEARGLIQPWAPKGLRLKDIAALEAIADGRTHER